MKQVTNFFESNTLERATSEFPACVMLSSSEKFVHQILAQLPILSALNSSAA